MSCLTASFPSRLVPCAGLFVTSRVSKLAKEETEKLMELVWDMSARSELPGRQRCCPTVQHLGSGSYGGCSGCDGCSQ